MRVLVLGGSTAGVHAAEKAAQAGHQVTLCTPYYALGEDAAGSWAVHSKAGWEAWRQRLGWLAMDEKPCPLTLKRALDVCLRAQGVRVLYVSRPAAIVQCGGAAAGALIEDDHGLGFYPADLVLDASAYGKYTAALTPDGLRFPAHARLSVCAAYKSAILPAAACDFQLLPGTMEDGHVLVRQDIPLPQPMTLGQMRRLHLRETARLCHAVAQSTLLGEQAALYPAFPSQPEITGYVKTPSPLRGLIYAEDWLMAGGAFQAHSGALSIWMRGLEIPCSVDHGAARLDIDRLPCQDAPVAILGGGTAGCCAAIGAAEEGASPLIIERGTLLGGTRTAGGMRGLYFGNRSQVFLRFFERWNRDAAQLHQQRTSATEALSIAAMMEEHGVVQKLCASVCGARIDDRRARRVLLATEEGLQAVSAAQWIDATGTGETAALMGCAMTFGDHETGRTQNYSQWRMCDSAHAGYQRLDQGTLDDPGKDSLSKEIQRCLHDPLAYDLVDMLTPREGRRLCGRVCVTLEDVMRGTAFADTLCHTFSTYDPHGRSFHPAGRLGLLPAQDAPRYAPVPLRALLPREIDNLLVCGKALSMDQDALNYARMAPDVMCVGYLAGRVAGMCVKQQCAAQALPLDPLQEEMRRAGAIVPVAPVPMQDTALRIACGDERGFAQAVLTNDAAVLTALPPFKQAGALSNRLLADKTRLWFGDISGAQRCTETLKQLCARLRGYAYIDRQGKDGVVRAGLVGPLDDYWLAIQLCVLLSKAHYAPAQPAILAFLRDTSIEDAWTNQESAYASIRLDCHTPPSYDRALSLAYACRLMPFADAAAELARLLRQTECGHACSRNPWQDYLSLCLRRALEACQKNG